MSTVTRASPGPFINSMLAPNAATENKGKAAIEPEAPSEIPVAAPGYASIESALDEALLADDELRRYFVDRSLLDTLSQASPESLTPRSIASTSSDTSGDFFVNVSQMMIPPGLQKVIEGLSRKSEGGFQDALTGLSLLGEDEASTRIFFHLHNIHLNESPGIVDSNDLNYGRNVFLSNVQGTFDEKLRAAQRTQLEILLNLAKGALSAESPNDQAVLTLALSSIENMSLDSKDLPEGQTNVAHALFGKLFEIYKAESKANPSLESPHRGRFNFDFGRHAFCGTMQVDVPVECKVRALHEIMASLKTAWKT